MIIQPNWTVTDQGPWQLIFNDNSIISLSQVVGVTSTQGKVFVGTQEECEAERVRLGLPWASEVTLDPDYKLIHEGGNILYFSVASEVAIDGVTFVGTQQECETEIARLGLTWPVTPIPVEEPVL